ncbi:unnamed protein product [Linum trigynum]|uniref:Uncharacterized protein n=1 Tax=Linum trigynum TaxID=586398 RepID=A0AAV2GDU0_9ROSI
MRYRSRTRSSSFLSGQPCISSCGRPVCQDSASMMRHPMGVSVHVSTPKPIGVEHDVMSGWLAQVPPSVKPSLTKQDTSMAQGASYQVKSSRCNVSSGKHVRQTKASSKLHQAPSRGEAVN